MGEYYYSQKPHVVHDLAEWSFVLKGQKLHFITDSGVFSRKTVDYGSRVLIEAFDWSQLPEGPILDMGCGYGPIGLALAVASGRAVEMVDVNERAVALAQKNATLNQINNVMIHTSDLYQEVKRRDFAAILSNPLIRAGKDVVHQILTESYEHLRVGGTLTVVLQKKQGAPSAKKKMQETFGNATIIKKDKGYYIIQSNKEG